MMNIDDLQRFSQLIGNELSSQEFQTLCFLLDINYSLLYGQDQSEKTDELFRILKQSNKLHLLEELPWLSSFLSEGIERDKAELIRLYLAIDEFFSFNQIQEMYRKLKVDDIQNSASKREKIRRFLLYINRRGRISELKEICFQMEPNFLWNKLILPVENISTNKSMTEEELNTSIINNFTTDDLQQLCFFLGIDFDDIGASYWLNKGINQLSTRELESLQNFGVNTHELTKKQFEIALKRLWVNQFMGHIRNRRSLAQIKAVYHYIYQTMRTLGL